MAVYYKFRSAKDYDSIPIDSHFISVANLKERIFESKHLGRGTDHDLEVINAQTNEEYTDEAMLIPKNTSVLVRRVPGRSRMPIVTQPEESMAKNKAEDGPAVNLNFTSADVSSMKDFEPPEWDDEFGNELYAPIPEVTSIQASNPTREDLPPSKADEDSKIKALIETPSLDWQSQAAQGFGSGRGFGRGGRMMGGRGFGRGGLEQKTPPQGYVCHRCKVPGHFIQHCPTNGDPNYDIKRVKPPTGIPKTMLMANPDGSIVLPSGAVGVLRPNEAAFEKEMEGLPSTRSVGDLPPELHCPLCKEVMKDAVLTSKCCFQSFCDKCIRDYIISKSVCVCGVRDVLADDLLPNKTVRDTINRILESNNSSGDNGGSAYQIQDMESARCPPPRIASPTHSAASKGEHVPPAPIEETPKPMEIANEERSAGPPPQPLTHQTSDKSKTANVPDVSEATHESASVREPASQPIEDEVQQKLVAAEAKKKKKKKPRLPVNGMDMQYRNPPEFAPDNFMMPMGMGHSAYNPYWNGCHPGMQPGMQPGMDGFMGPFGGGMPYNMGYGGGPMDMHFPGVVPHDPFMAQNHMFPMMPPQRDLVDYGMGFNARPQLMSREEFLSKQADLRRKREMERLGEREVPKDRDHGREGSSSVNALPMKSKPKMASSRREPSEDRYSRERDLRRDSDHDRRPHRGGSTSSTHRMERTSPAPPRPEADHPPHLPSKRKAEHHHQPSSDSHSQRDRHRDHDRRQHHHRRAPSPKPSSDAPPPQKPSAAELKQQKASVFSRISFGGGEPSKKRKLSSEPKPAAKETAAPANGYDAVTVSASSMGRKNQFDYESSDDDRHFKRKPARYEPLPPPQPEEDGRRQRRPKDRERERESSRRR